MAPKKQPYVCRGCHRVVDGDSCVMCGSSNLTQDWAGYLVIIDPKHSDIGNISGIHLALFFLILLPQRVYLQAA